MSYLNSAVPYRILNLAGKNSADPPRLTKMELDMVEDPDEDEVKFIKNEIRRIKFNLQMARAFFREAMIKLVKLILYNVQNAA